MVATKLQGGRTKSVSATRVPKAKLAPQARQMREMGLTVKMIAEKLGRSERYVYQLLKVADTRGSTAYVEVPDPKDKLQLEPRCLEMVKGTCTCPTEHTAGGCAGEELTADGFEKFFNAYSGRVLAPVHKEWVHQALSTRRTLINCPPRHAKSTIFSAWFPIWLIAADRNVQILIASQTEKIARKFTNEISYHLAYNQDLIRDFGRFRPELADWPWRPNSGELLVDGRSREFKSGDLTCQVRGAGQAILGMEANWVICDDSVSRKHVKSETERETLSEWFHGDVMSRLEPGGRAVVIGQRLHIHDLYGELSGETIPDGSMRWDHINYKAISDWDNKVTLWPEKWGFEELMDPYMDLGSSLFEAMYQQNPLPEGEALARRAWIYGDDSHVGCVDLDRVAGAGATGLHRPVRVVSLDPSPTRYAGLIVADLEYDTNQFQIHVIEIRREKMSVRDMLTQIHRVVDWYEPRYFIFEQNAAQRWLLQDPAMAALRRQVHIVPHTTSRNKKDPVMGVESLAVDIEFGRIRLPYGDPEAKVMSELFIKEALEYPQGETDDLLMALWFIKTNFQSLVPSNYSSDSSKGRGFRIPKRLQEGWERRKRVA